MKLIKGRWQPAFVVVLCALAAVAFVARDLPARAQDQGGDTGLSLDDMPMPGPVVPAPLDASGAEEALPASPPPTETATDAEPEAPAEPAAAPEPAPVPKPAPLEGFYGLSDIKPASIAVARGVGARPSRHWPKEAREEAANEAVFGRQVALDVWNKQVAWHTAPVSSGAAWMKGYVGTRSTPATASGRPQGLVRGMPSVQVRGLLYVR